MKKTIGMFKGKFLEEATREELLDFAGWAGGELNRLTKIENETQDYRIRQEILSPLKDS